MVMKNNINKNFGKKKVMGISTVISGAAIEVAAVISALPIKRYKEEYRKLLAEAGMESRKKISKLIYGSVEEIKKEVLETWKGKITKSKLKSVVLGTVAIILMAVGIKLQADERKSINKDICDKLDGKCDKKCKCQKDAAAEEIITEAENNEIKKWTCGNCDHENDGEKKTCTYCGALRADILSQALNQW